MNALEVPRKIALIGEPDIDGRHRRRHALRQQRPRPLHAYVVLVGVRRYSKTPDEAAQQMEPAETGRRRQFVQRHRLVESIAQKRSRLLHGTALVADATPRRPALEIVFQQQL